MPVSSVTAFIESADVAADLLSEVRSYGFGRLRWDVTPQLHELEALFARTAARISHQMQAQAEGRGAYAHLTESAISPLKPVMERLYEAASPHLEGDEEAHWPPTIDRLWDRCRAAGQTESAVLALDSVRGSAERIRTARSALSSSTSARCSRLTTSPRCCSHLTWRTSSASSS